MEHELIKLLILVGLLFAALFQQINKQVKKKIHNQHILSAVTDRLRRKILPAVESEKISTGQSVKDYRFFINTFRKKRLEECALAQHLIAEYYYKKIQIDPRNIEKADAEYDKVIGLYARARSAGLAGTNLTNKYMLADDAQMKIAKMNIINLEDIQGALDSFSEFIRDYPDSPMIEEARQINRFISENAADGPQPIAMWLRAEALEKTGEADAFSQAISELAKISFHYPKSRLSLPARYKSCEVFWRRLSDYKMAIIEARRIIDDFPASEYAPRAQIFIANIHLEKCDWHDAIAEFEKFLEKFPENSTEGYVRFRLVECYEKIKDAEKANFHRAKILEKEPDGVWAAGIRSRP